MKIEITEKEREFLHRMVARAILLADLLSDTINVKKAEILLAKLVKNENN